MAAYENLQQVLLQMEQFGIELKDKDLTAFPKRLDKRVTCGQGGKDYYKLHEFRPDAGGVYLTGGFGTYRHGGSYEKVEIDWKPLGEEERARIKAQREAAAAAAAARRAEEVANAAAEAITIWRRGVAPNEKPSPYLERKQVKGESCRVLPQQLVLRWTGQAPGEDDTVVRLEGGTLLLPLLRLDFAKEHALRAIQFVRPDGSKCYMRGFDKLGCCVRLGAMPETPRLLLVCEGYATGGSIRAAVDYEHPVFVAFDAGNLAHVVPMLRSLHPSVRILVCADDDWKTADRKGRPTNPGRTAAKAVAKATPGCDIVWPVFPADGRGDKHTDFNDLHVLHGLDLVRSQLQGVIEMMGRVYG